MRKEVGATVAALVMMLVAESSRAAAGPRTLVEAARGQIGRTVRYDPAYRALAYPGGDVPEEAGVCTDVIIRALRRARGMDLQRLVHEDMRRNFAEYPRDWGLRKPDRNIDHRRVPNLRKYFERQGWSLPVSRDAREYHAGDLVTCVVPPNLPHIMLVSDRKTEAGVPLVLHNIGAGTREEDRLFEFRITGHYRVPAGAEGGRDGVAARGAAGR